MRVLRATLLGGALVALALIPTQALEALPPVCLFRNLFGVRCLGCGMTRAFSALLHADLAAALAYNKLVLVAMPLVCGIVFWDAARLLAAATSSCSRAETWAPVRRWWRNSTRRP